MNAVTQRTANAPPICASTFHFIRGRSSSSSALFGSIREGLGGLAMVCRDELTRSGCDRKRASENALGAGPGEAETGRGDDHPRGGADRRRERERVTDAVHEADAGSVGDEQ